MATRLPLEKMTVEEKLQAMEALWEDLTRNAENYEPPAWHGDALKALEQAIERGEETFEDWETAKKRIRAKLREN